VTIVPRPDFSVAICTRDRPERIAGAVESVIAQEFPNFEVLVIDQSHSNLSATIVEQLRRRHPNLRYLALEEVGLSRARNAAIESAQADLVAFTDDDCEVPAGWLETMAGCFLDQELDLVFGQVLLPPDLFGREGRDGVTPMLPIPSRVRLDASSGFKVFGMGANCGLRRSAWARVGGFDTFLGTGGPMLAGEDFDFSYRIFRTGGAILLEPDLVVYHRGFRSLSEWPSTVRAYGVGVGSFYFKHVRLGDRRAAGMLLRTLLRETAGATRKLVRAKPARNQWSYAVSLVRGMARSLQFDVDPRLRVYRPRPDPPRTAA